MFDSLSTNAMQEIRAIPSALVPVKFSFTYEDLRRHLYGRKAVETIDIEKILRKRKLLDNDNERNKRSSKNISLTTRSSILG